MGQRVLGVGLMAAGYALALVAMWGGSQAASGGDFPAWATIAAWVLFLPALAGGWSILQRPKRTRPTRF